MGAPTYPAVSVVLLRSSVFLIKGCPDRNPAEIPLCRVTDLAFLLLWSHVFPVGIPVTPGRGEE